MSKQVWFIEREQLLEWKKLLSDEPSVPGDGIDTIMNEIDEILIQIREREKHENRVEVKGLTFDEIIVGETYLMIDNQSVKESLRNKPMKIIEKKQKNVIGELQVGLPRHKLGSRFTINPATLVKP